MALKHCRLVKLPKLADERGNLSFVESWNHIPFEIKRTYYLYDIPAGSARAAHGHKALQQLMIAVSGSFDVILDDGNEKITFHLNKPDVGLYISPMIWRDINNFSSNAVCVVLASEFYDESDYYRKYPDFIAAVKE